ncbi:hypothetical protein ABZ349_14490 [Streptomyces niveus]|uniref:beta family protein n=1 Tax=Streptomyces niveus TaxID=193462 RepID=UPI0033DFF6A0
MPGPLYIPVLPTRDNATGAYRDLAPEIRDRVSALWTVPPGVETDPTLLERKLRKAIGPAALAQRHSAGWLDAPFGDQSAAPLADVLYEYWTTSPLRPVTGPERPREQQTGAARAARESGNGLGIRVQVLGRWDDAVASATHKVLDLVGANADGLPLDLLLDLHRVFDERHDAGKEALRALDALHPLADWRDVATLSGGYPDQPGEVTAYGVLGEAARADWELWHELRHSGRDYAPLIRYGDYAALSARGIATTYTGNGGPPWGILRYTTDRAFLLVKVQARGDGRGDSIRAAAQLLTTQDDYRGPGFSWGDRWLRDCALGSGSKGTGTASTWSKAGNSQHMTYVARRVRDMGAE